MRALAKLASLLLRRDFRRFAQAALVKRQSKIPTFIFWDTNNLVEWRAVMHQTNPKMPCTNGRSARAGLVTTKTDGSVHVLVQAPLALSRQEVGSKRLLVKSMCEV